MEEWYLSMEGNIGVGKTTLSRKFYDYFVNGKKESAVLIEERVNGEWLHAFLENPGKMATLFQIKRLMETINAVKEMGAKRETYHHFKSKLHCVGDRLPLGNLAFAMVHYQSGNMESSLFDLYGTTLSDGGPYVYPDILFLRCSPEKSLERIRHRNRGGETSYTLDYLRQLDEANHFIFLYVWAYDIVNVFPISWETFDKDPSLIANKLLHRRFLPVDLPLLRQEVQTHLKTMSYERMKEIMNLLEI
jgi:deoxyadenosine/deoxycytidine kinase